MKISKDDLSRIEKAVQEAERKTSGEVVVMLVRSSVSVHHTALKLLLFFFVIFPFSLEVLQRVWPAVLISLFEWPWHWFLAYVMAAIGLAWMMSQMEYVQRHLIFKADRVREVERRAQLEFYQQKIGQTAGSTGVLIFISLLEHHAVVLADRGIASILPADTWNGVIQTILEEARKGQIADGIVEGVGICGGLLAQHFPIQAGDRNELANHLILKD